MITFEVITIFPELVEKFATESLLKRAGDKKLLKITARNLRDFSLEKRSESVV